MKLSATAVLVFLLLIELLLVGGVYSTSAISFRKGVSLSPKSYDPSDFTGFFSKAKQAGTVVSWAGDWLELSRQDSAPYVVTGLASSYGYTPVIELQFFSQSTGQLLRPLNDANKKTYLDSAVAFASEYKPSYLALGIEVNVLFEKSPAEFEQFTNFYAQVYDAVKATSPGTKVFTIFQLEKMKGLGGGLFGGSNDPSKNEWALLERFPRNDILSLTTYPSLIFKDPSELPNDYYSEIASHTSKPVAIIETGWHTASSPIGWEGSDSKQAAFVTRLFSSISAMNIELVVWSFLYDQNVIEPFNSMGLWRRDGTSKPAWQTWLSVQTTATITTASSASTTSTQGGSPKCLIATAASGSELAPPVQFLRAFRDTEVKSTYLGYHFMLAFDRWYYSWSPQVARIEADSTILRATIRTILLPLLSSLFLAEKAHSNVAPFSAELAILLAGLIGSSSLGLCYLSPILWLGQRNLRRRFGRRAFVAAAIVGIVFASWGTMSYDLTDVIATVTVVFILETMILTPLAVVRALTRFQ